MRFRFLITALVPLAFTACLSGAETITYPNVPIEQTTFASSLDVNLAASCIHVEFAEHRSAPARFGSLTNKGG